jgi:hypothetical protein
MLRARIVLFSTEAEGEFAKFEVAILRPVPLRGPGVPWSRYGQRTGWEILSIACYRERRN